MDSSWEQAKLLDGDSKCLAATCRLQRTVIYIGAGTLDIGFCLGLDEEIDFEAGVCHSPRSPST